MTEAGIGRDEWTYEGLRERLSRISAPESHEERPTLWTIDRLLGIAVASTGAYELFIAGPRLRPNTSLVRRHLDHGLWSSPNGDQFEANRVVFPNAPHFATIAAVVAVEMVRMGLGQNDATSQEVFDQVEPIIELALRRGALSEELMLGLLGELLLLSEMLHAVADRPELRGAVLDMWRGPKDAARDYVVGETAIEVKTTALLTSSHHIQSLAQVEPGGEKEKSLFLFSVGLREDARGGLQLGELADAILGQLADAAIDGRSPLQDRFVGVLSDYGSRGGDGYRHYEMKNLPIYATRFTPTFTPRLYDMCDSEVRLVRRSDLLSTFVSPEEISFRIDLPETITDDNPVPDWTIQVRQFVRQSVGLSVS
ncbi:MAG: hypothetical protein JW395_0421 [Nitrospira sp.]|nr:hypothetical protein [Nitrospira sp.]